MSLLNASELFQFAIRIEENGEKFYRDMARKFDQERFKEFFIVLADEESEHKKIFEEMVSKIESYDPPESYPGEYFSYLRAYADEIIFNQEKLKNEIDKISTPISAIDFAIAREWESISYYQEIKESVPKAQQNHIEKIIKEERKHFIKLSDGKKIFQNL